MYYKMIDITGPKVLLPTALFVIFNLIWPNGPIVAKAVGASIVYWVIATFISKVSLTTADLVVPVALFIALTPGVIMTLPGDTHQPIAVAVHALVFSIVFALLRGQFPQFY